MTLRLFLLLLFTVQGFSTFCQTSINFGSTGNTYGCGPHTITFTISGNIGAFTNYVLNFGDGSPPQSFTQATLPSTISHTYAAVSCGQNFTSGGNAYPNAYGATLTASNSANGQTGGWAVYPIRISKKPTAAFTKSTNTICVGSPITFTNISEPGVTYSADGSTCDNSNSFYWQITGPSAGSVVSGSMGSDNSFPDDFQGWTSGTSPLEMQFSVPGNYQIKLKIANLCNIDSSTLNFCVVAKPQPQFTINPTTGCFPPNLDVATTNNTVVTPNPCFATTYASTWSASPATGWTFSSGNASSSNPGFRFAAAGTYIISLDTRVNGLTACSASTTQTITVTQAPIVDAGPPRSVCVGGAAIQLVGTPSGGTWSGAGVNASGLFTPPATTGQVTLTYTLPVSGSCPASSDQMVVSVNPVPTVTVTPSAPAVCNGLGVALNVSSSPAGATFSWIPSGSLSSSSGSSVTATPGTTTSYTVTGTIASTGCSSSTPVTVTVHPNPTVTVPAIAPICPGGSVSLTATANGGQTPYTYAWSPTGGLSSATGQTVNASPPGTTSYTVTATDARGCKGSTNTTVTVNQTPTVNAGNDVLVCNVPTAYAMSGYSPAGGTWSGTGVSANGNFTSPGVGTYTLTYTLTQNACTGSDQVVVTVINPTAADAGPDRAVCLNSAALLLSGSPSPGVWSGSAMVSSSGTFTPASAGTYTLSYSAGSGSCAVSDNVIITVHALPAVTVNDPVICAGSTSVLTASGSGGVSPYTYSWSPTTGISSGSGASVNFTGPASALFTVTATDANGCSGSDVSSVTVNALPTVIAGPDLSLCNNPVPTTLTGFSPPGGTWSGTGVTSAGVFTPAGTGSFILTYSFTDGNSCTNTADVSVAVIDPSSVSAGNDTAVCLNSPALTLKGNPAGGTWAGSSQLSNIGTFTPSVAGVFKLTYTSGSGTCAVSDTSVVTVNTLPTVAVNDTIFCSGAAVPLNAVASGGQGPYSYQWSPGVGLDATSGATVTTNSATSTSYTVSINDVNGCSASDVSSVTVNDLPAVNAGIDLTLCNTPTVTQLQGTPANGTWSGSGVNASGAYSPTGDGQFMIKYSFTDGNGCSSSDSLLITVTSPQIVNAGNDTSICLFSSFILTGQTPGTGSWSGNGQVSANGQVAAADTGTFTVTYTDGVGTCAVSDERVITVVALPVVDAGANVSTCHNALPLLFPDESPASGGTWKWNGPGIVDSLSGAFDPASIGPGLFTVFYKFTEAASGCTNSDSLEVTVNALTNIVLAFRDLQVCMTPFSSLLSAQPVGGTWRGPGLNFSNDLISPADSAWFTPTATGTFEAIYSFIDQNQCTNTDTVSISVESPVPVEAGPSLSFCYNAVDSVQLNGIPADGRWSDPKNPLWLRSNGVFLPNHPDTAMAIFTKGSGSCQTWDTTEVVIFSLPPVNAGVDTFRCLDDACIQLLPVFPPGGTWSGNGITNSNGLFCSQTSGEGEQKIQYHIDTTYHYQNLSSTCLNHDSMTVLVVPMPRPGLIVDSVLCVNTNYNLGNTSSGPAAQFEWYILKLPNNDTVFYSREQSPVLNLPSPGSFRLYLNSISSYGCSVNTFTDFMAVTTPVPKFSISEDLSCGPFQGIISDQSQGYLPDYEWNFGPSFQTSTEVNPSMPEYPSPVISDSVYTVELSLTNLCGTIKYKDSVTVRPKPVARIGTDYSLGCSPMNVNLQNISYGSPSAFSWNFGDGTAASDSLPTAVTLSTDSSIRTFTISLSVNNSCGSSADSTEVIVYPSHFSLRNILPERECAPYNFSFVAPDRGQTFYLWDFGDQSGAVGDSVSHHYEEPGVYTVQLTVSNYCFSDSVAAQLTLMAGPELDFTLSANAVCEGGAVQFTNSSTLGDAFEWSINNNPFPTYSPTVNQLFPVSGSVSIGLAGTNPQTGCKDTLFKSIGVIPRPTISVVAEQAIGCIPFMASFINTTQNANAYEWHFSDGTNATVASPSVEINNLGNFKATLIAHNYQNTVFDCPDTTEVNVWVNPSPASAFSLTVDKGCGPPVGIQPNNESSGANAYKWFWQNQTSTAMNPAITLTDTGRHAIGLIAYNEFSCTDTSYKNFMVYGQPEISFDLLPSEGCTPFEVQFKNLTQYGDSVSWGFGDGSFSEQYSPTHTYTEPGFYSVELYMSSGKGMCSDDTLASQAIHSFPVAYASFSAIPHTVKQNEPVVYLSNNSSGYTGLRFFVDTTFVDTTVPLQYNLNEPDSGTVNLVLIANNEFNCPDTSIVEIYVKASPNIYFPEAFSPNGDGKNDKFKFYFDRVPTEFKAWIFDRWGEEIFYTEDFEGEWDGTYKGREIQQDVYILKYSATFEGSLKIGMLFKNVTLIR